MEQLVGCVLGASYAPIFILHVDDDDDDGEEGWRGGGCLMAGGRGGGARCAAPKAGMQSCKKCSFAQFVHSFKVAHDRVLPSRAHAKISSSVRTPHPHHHPHPTISAPLRWPMYLLNLAFPSVSRWGRHVPTLSSGNWSQWPLHPPHTPTHPPQPNQTQPELPPPTHRGWKPHSRNLAAKLISSGIKADVEHIFFGSVDAAWWHGLICLTSIRKVIIFSTPQSHKSQRTSSSITNES